MVNNFNAFLTAYRKFGIDAHLYTIELDRDVFSKTTRGAKKGEKINLPLGWYLSNTSSDEITRQATYSI